MRAYVEFAKKAFQERLAYKSDALLNILSMFLLLFIQVNVWTALYRNHAVMEGITLRDMITFVMVSMMVQSLTASRMDCWVATIVEDGTVICYFAKPISFKYYLIAENAGNNLFRALFSCLPACIFGILFWGVRTPQNPSTYFFFVITLAGGIMLTAQLNYVISLLSFWFKTAHFVDWLVMAFRDLFAGAIVPLWFYPPSLKLVSECLPWRLGGFSPIAVLLEKVTPAETLRIIVLQAVWLVGLLWIERVLWSRAQVRVESFGG